MEVPRRKALPHEIPLWVDPQKEIYFITINCEDRSRNQLALSDVAERLFETVRHRQEKFLWWPHLFLLMPDHLHALLSFPPSDKPLKSVVSKWKEWTAKELSLVWQRDFFEHRLRHDESRREKTDYILQESRPQKTGHAARRLAIRLLRRWEVSAVRQIGTARCAVRSSQRDDPAIIFLFGSTESRPTTFMISLLWSFGGKQFHELQRFCA